MNSGNLNKGNIGITNFYLSDRYSDGIQMVVGYSDNHLNNGPVFKWWPEY